MHHEKRSSSRLPLDARHAHWRWESSSRLLGCMLIKTNRFRFCCPSRDATPCGWMFFVALRDSFAQESKPTYKGEITLR